MDRDEAKRLMESKLKNKNLRKHVLAVAAVMRRLAERFGEDGDKWELTGLLHDLDLEETRTTSSVTPWSPPGGSRNWALNGRSSRRSRPTLTRHPATA